MASKLKQLSFNPTQDDDDDDFQTPLTQTATARRRKENIPPPLYSTPKDSVFNQDCSLDSLPESFAAAADVTPGGENEKGKGGYMLNSIESRLIQPGGGWGFGCSDGDVLLRLNGDGVVEEDENGGLVLCPLCEVDISELGNEDREAHTNECLDKQQDMSFYCWKIWGE